MIAEGSYETESVGGMIAALAGLPFAIQPARTTRYTVRHKGLLNGLAVKGLVTIERDDEAKATLLTAGPKSKEALMVISDDLSEIRVYEKDAPEDERFYQLKRIET